MTERANTVRRARVPSAEGGNARCVRDGKALPHPDEGVDGTAAGVMLNSGD